MHRFVSIVFMFALYSSIGFSHGQSVNSEQVAQAALSWIKRSPVFQNAIKNGPVKEEFEIAEIEIVLTGIESIQPLYHVALAPSGFLLVNTDEKLSPVVAFSPTSSLDLSGESENPFLATVLKSQSHANKMLRGLELPRQSIASLDVLVQKSSDNKLKWELLLQPQPALLAANISTDSILVAPMLETAWTQWRHYNNFCPKTSVALNGYDNRVPTGCVPTAGAQIMKYHEWPPFGTGSHNYSDTNGSVRGVHSASFSDPFDWSHMLRDYSPMKDEEGIMVEAVAELMYEIGVAIEADYEAKSTSSFLPTLAKSLYSHFYYEKGTYIQRQADDSFDHRMRKDLSDHCPVLASSDKHAFVIDGLSEEFFNYFYHINYGWGSETWHQGENYNVWYALDDIQGEPIFSAVFGTKPKFMPIIDPPDITTITGDSFTLNWQFPKRLESKLNGFRIRRNGFVLNSSIPRGSRSYSVTGLLYGRHTFTIQANDGVTWRDESPAKTIQVIQIVNPPQVTIHPIYQEAFIGDSILFSVTTDGIGPFSYQWKHNGVIMPGQIGAFLQLSNLQASQAGIYAVVVSDAGGQSETSANLIIKQPPATSAYSKVVLEDKPLLYYRFEETANMEVLDATPNARHGISTNLGYSPSVSVALGNAASFNGTNASVMVPTLSSIESNTLFSQFTIEAWVNVQSFNNPEGFECLYNHDGWSDGSIHMHVNPGNRWEFSVNGSIPTDHYLGNANLFCTNAWYHLVAVYDSKASTLHRYVNGYLATNITYNASPPVDLGAAHIGAWNGSSRFFRGFIDEVALYPTALSAERIAAHYHAALSIASPSLTLTRFGSQFILSWIAPGFGLQRNSSLNNANGWSEVLDGDSSPVLLNIAPGEAFFRLNYRGVPVREISDPTNLIRLPPGRFTK